MERACTKHRQPLEVKCGECVRELEAELRAAAEALERVATVPVDGRGLDYYWQGRDIASKAAERARAALRGE